MPVLHTILARIKYSDARMYVVHCFDNRPLWFRIWNAICVPGILLARIPLAGAAAKGKHYWRFFQDKAANMSAPVIFATHYPCGWFEGQSESVIIAHGKKVVDFLKARGMKVIHLHFSLRDGVLKLRVYDPDGLAATDSIVARVLEAAGKLDGMEPSEDATDFVPTPRVVLAKEVFGPPIGEGILVVHERFVVSDTFFIACKLNGGEPIRLECAEQVYVPNYEREAA